jgi:hypothetical protein
MLTADQITQRLRLAAEAVEGAGLSEDLRQIAFKRSLDAVGFGLSQAAAPVAGSGLAPVETSRDESPAATTSVGLVDRVTARLDLEVGAVALVYEEVEGEIRLIVKRAVLPDGKAAAMRNVAQLVVVGRQAAGLEEYTPYEAVREECKELRILDVANFASEMAKLEFRTRGRAAQKEARANRHHYDDVAAVIRRIADRSAP